MIKNVLYISLLFVSLFPGIVYAKTNCRLVEFPDHYEAICEGDEKYIPRETGYSKPVTVIVTNGERRPPAAVMEDAIAARRKLILDLRQKDLETNSPTPATPK